MDNKDNRNNNRKPNNNKPNNNKPNNNKQGFGIILVTTIITLLLVMGLYQFTPGNSQEGDII